MIFILIAVAILAISFIIALFSLVWEKEADEEFLEGDAPDATLQPPVKEIVAEPVKEEPIKDLSKEEKIEALRKKVEDRQAEAEAFLAEMEAKAQLAREEAERQKAQRLSSLQNRRMATEEVLDTDEELMGWGNGPKTGFWLSPDAAKNLAAREEEFDSEETDLLNEGIELGAEEPFSEPVAQDNSSGRSNISGGFSMKDLLNQSR